MKNTIVPAGRMDRRQSLLTLAALASLAPARTLAQSGSLTEITYGNLSPSAGGWPIYIAQQQGFFRDEGLAVTIVPFGGPQDLIVGVGTGAVDIGEVQTDSGIEAVAHGFAMKIIAPTFITVPYRLVVGPTITTWPQLKTVSVSLGSKIGSTVIAYRRLLKAHNVDVGPDDLSIVVAGNSTLRLAALKSGAVQATMLAQPYDFLAQTQGLRIMADANDVMEHDWIFSAMLTANAWGNANRASVVKFLRAYRRAIQFGYAHRDESVKILMPMLNTDRDTAEKTYDLTFVKWKGFDAALRIDAASLTTMGNALVGFGDIARVPAAGEMYDGSYAAAALR
jgi:ABC-type nitrate/sulfonate/bicarbonate transport system substrate-binding protein